MSPYESVVLDSVKTRPLGRNTPGLWAGGLVWWTWRAWYTKPMPHKNRGPLDGSCWKIALGLAIVVWFVQVTPVFAYDLSGVSGDFSTWEITITEGERDTICDEITYNSWTLQTNQYEATNGAYLRTIACDDLTYTLTCDTWGYFNGVGEQAMPCPYNITDIYLIGSEEAPESFIQTYGTYIDLTETFDFMLIEAVEPTSTSEGTEQTNTLVLAMGIGLALAGVVLGYKVHNL